MKIVHYGHACVLLDTGSVKLLFDPGVLSNGYAELTGLDAVLITHQHPDHIDGEGLAAVLRNNPDARLVIDPGSKQTIDDLSLGSQVAHPGERLEINGSRIDVVGGQHAVIHPEIPVVRNSGYVIDDGAFYHPGDALFVPEQPIDVLGLPTDAPWLRSAEAIDFMRIVGPRVAVPIHQGVLATPQFWYGQFTSLAPATTTVEVLEHGATAEL